MSDDVGLLMEHDEEGEEKREEGEDDRLLEEPPWEVDSRRAEVYYGRLCTLIIREGTKRLREFTKANIDHGADLLDVLGIESIQAQFINLKKRRAITAHQYKILYPSEGSFVVDQVDISLWVILARNLARGRELIDWDKTPGPDDDMKLHHVLRLRDARNQLYHMSQSELTTAAFERMWGSIGQSLMKLGSREEELYEMKTCELEPERLKMCEYEVQQQALKDQCSKLESEAANKHCLLGGFVLLLALLVVAFVVIIVIVVLYTRQQSCAHNLQKLSTKEALMQFMPRSGWGARNPRSKEMNRFHGPVDHLVVSQTALNGACLSHDDCCQAVRTVQAFNMDKSGYGDIAFNYLVGGDGVAYEGRGQFFQPATIPWWNNDLISMGFIGYFANNKPTEDALNAAKILVQYLVDIGALSYNKTKVMGLCQMYGKKYPRSPGVAIMREMETWKGSGWKWDPENETDCEGVTLRDFAVHLDTW